MGVNTAIDKSKVAAYGGGSWKWRGQRSIDERYWNGGYGLNSEYRALKHVLLHVPNMTRMFDPEAFQMLEKPNDHILSREIAEYSNILQGYGVDVTFIDRPVDNYRPNMMFARDLFAMTPQGAIIGRPASDVRAGEEVYAQSVLTDIGIPSIYSMHDNQLFEGSDMLWLTPKHCIVAVNRTSPKAAHIVEMILSIQKVSVEIVALPPEGNQHILGTCNIINDKVALVRPDKCPQNLIPILDLHGYTVVEVPEHEEVVHRQAMNLVTLKPGHILMPTKCPVMRSFYEKCPHITQIDEVEIDECMKAAGGLACMTGILQRELV